MIKIRDIDYQNEALNGCIEEGQEGLVAITNRLLKMTKKDNYPEVIFKAITGAGKTIIMAKYINEIYEEEDRPPIVFVWLSIGTGGLHFQSANKIKPLLSSKVTKVICPETEKDFNKTEFRDGEILILNWEKVNNTKKNQFVSNLMVGEKHNLKQAVKNTSKDIKFIVLIDEFHKNYGTIPYTLIMDLFKPIMILGMTATPTEKQLANKYAWHYVPTSKVRASGMIKKGTVFNENCSNIVLSEDSPNGLEEEILKVAIAKRIELEKILRDEGSSIIPLCLIQVPNSDTEFLNRIINFLSEQKEYNKPLIEDEDFICWMTEVPKNKDLIENIDSNRIKYLIFKQSVATGWDCPRAHILVKYRQLKKEIDSFDLQTIGRVLRMPERKHYKKNDDINYAYIYAPEARFSFDREVEEAIGDVTSKNQKLKYVDDINALESFMESEQLEERNLKFYRVKELFMENLKNEYANAKANSNFKQIHIFDGIAETNDSLLEDNINLNNVSNNTITYNSVELGRKFTAFMKILGKPYLTQNNIRAILFEFFDSIVEDALSDEDKILETIKCCLMYQDTIIKALLETGKKVHQETQRIKKENKSFIFQRSPKYYVKDETTEYKKCVYNPCVDKGLTGPEHIFIQTLEKNPNVKWWYKNLDKGQNSLCIIYEESEYTNRGKQSEILAPTYPDFIVCFNENNKLCIGIYEIKDVDKVEIINYRKDIAIKRYVNYLVKKTKDDDCIGNIYGGVVKIKKLGKDEFKQFMGKIHNIGTYPELKY